jgi:hypothetical protein
LDRLFPRKGRRHRFISNNVTKRKIESEEFNDDGQDNGNDGNKERGVREKCRQEITVLLSNLERNHSPTGKEHEVPISAIDVIFGLAINELQ